MKTLIVIQGPTASGKTDVGVRLANHFDTEIISADSRQIFKEMKIGTARPDEDILKKTKHYFVAQKSVLDYYNASMFENEVLSLLEHDIFLRKDIVLMVGGSMLYIDAVCNGIDFLPDPDVEIRNSLWQTFYNSGIEVLLKKLELLDPEYTKIVDKNNHKRIIKALEVCLQTGKPYSSFRTGLKKERNFKILKISLNYPREILHERINLRVDKMMSQGLLKEVEKLLPYRNLNSLNTVGYRELFDYLDNKCSLAEAVELIKRNTRRYARRQISWFNRDQNVEWFCPDSIDKIVERIDSFIEN